MPVSHLGLTVSHLPSATSFYLAALQPLGYRYIGHQGDSIGLGVDSADFFISQYRGSRVSPNHIAFLADSRSIVRDCYTAALNAGGYPSGSPSYRNDDCSCFNAAVEDPDHNTIEFIFREPHGDGHHGVSAPEDSRVLTWQKSVVDSDDYDEEQSVTSRGSRASKASRAKSRVSTALHLASTTSKSIKSSRSEAPSRGVTRSYTEPMKSSSGIDSKAFFGTVLGAAAGAAIAYAMVKSEQDNKRDEARHYASSRSRHSVDGTRPTPLRAETLPSSSSLRSSEAKDNRRNYRSTDSAYSSRQPPTQSALRAIEAAPAVLSEVQTALSRLTSSRPPPRRSQTYDEIIYSPTSRNDRSEAPRSSHRRTTLSTHKEMDREDYYLEGPPRRSTSRHTHRAKDPDTDLKRHDSGLSMHSSRSRPHHSSTASTAHASRCASDSAAGIPLPSSKPSTVINSTSGHPAAISLPPSSHYHSTVSRQRAGPPASTISAARIALPASRVEEGAGWETSSDDGLADTRALVPGDSISCVGLNYEDEAYRREEGSGRRRASTSTARRSEAGSDRTVRAEKRRGSGSRHSALTLPVRSSARREERRAGRRAGSYA